MNLRETIRTALRDLTLHKFRSALATLGIIFGVASVQAMLSISEGARGQAMEQIQLLGVDNLFARSVRPTSVARQAPTEQQSFVLTYGLTRADMAYIRGVFPLVRHTAGVRNVRKRVYSHGSMTELDLAVLATEPEYLHITRSTLVAGRFIAPLDGVDGSLVCVLGEQAAREIFKYENPIGRSVLIGGDYFTVVGLLRHEAALRDTGGDDINNAIFIPLGTYQLRYGDMSVTIETGSQEITMVELDTIAIQLEDESAVLPTAARLGQYLKQQHSRGDFELLVPLELMHQKARTGRIFAIVMGSIAGISLLIGGIGVMNIMLANVSDRRKEIGTRRALGATRGDVIRQFLVEAAVLTSLGGIAGVAVGYGLSSAVAYWAEWPVTMTAWGAVLGMLVSSGSGLIFGLWPAHQAAKVNPIEALRSG